MMTIGWRNLGLVSALAGTLLACADRKAAPAASDTVGFTDSTGRRVVIAETIRLADSSSRVWQLDPGIYEVEVNVDDRKSGGNGLELTWDPPTCLPKQEAQQIRDKCATPGGNGNLKIINPPSGRLASSVQATVKLIRLPSP